MRNYAIDRVATAMRFKALYTLQFQKFLQQRDHTGRYSPKYFHDNSLICRTAYTTSFRAVEHEMHNETISIYAEITF
jgi:hypothetical protein